MADKETKDVTVKKQTVEEMELEIKALELEAKQLEVQERRDQVNDRKIKRENKESEARTKGQALKSIADGEAQSQKRCSHKKGGNGLMALVKGGNDQQYAAIKHTFHNGDTWVRCQRCGKTWKPPIGWNTLGSAEAAKDPVIARAFVEYERALEFDTRNTPSGGVMFKYSDGGQFARESMANTTLR